MRGASNFRQIPDTNIYALGQPTIEAIDEVVCRIKSEHPDAQQIIWITLREEPIVYINGAPYCLRREMFSLRNIKGDGFACLFHTCTQGYKIMAAFLLQGWKYLRKG